MVCVRAARLEPVAELSNLGRSDRDLVEPLGSGVSPHPTTDAALDGAEFGQAAFEGSRRSVRAWPEGVL